jgi:PleD family two-component response regulator
VGNPAEETYCYPNAYLFNHLSPACQRFFGRPNRAGWSPEKGFAIAVSRSHAGGVTQPLALVLYEKLLPGTQLINRLQDLHYRVLPVTQPDQLLAVAAREGPMLLLADLAAERHDVCALIAAFRRHPATAHVPVLAFAEQPDEALVNAARAAGATMVVGHAALLAHLPELLEQVLQVE